MWLHRVLAVAAMAAVVGATGTANATDSVARTIPLPMPPYLLTMLNLLLGFATSFLIGANDAANSWATTVGSGVLAWSAARVLACVFEVCGGMSSHAISEKIIAPANRKGPGSFHDGFDSRMDLWPAGVVAAQVGSSAWQVIVTALGIPSSGTHSVLGGVIGMATHWSFIDGPEWVLFGRLAVGWFLSPVAAALMAFLLLRAALLLSGVSGSDMLGSRTRCFQSTPAFPLLSCGFLCLVSCAANQDHLFHRVAFGTVCLTAGVALRFLHGRVRCPCGASAARRAGGRSSGSGGGSRAGFAVFAGACMWLMAASSVTLVLMKKSKIGVLVGCTRALDAAHITALALCAVPAALSAAWVWRALRSAPRPAADQEGAALGAASVPRGVAPRDGARMNPALATFLARDASWVGVVGYRGDTWAPLSADVSPATSGGARQIGKAPRGARAALGKLLGRGQPDARTPWRDGGERHVVEYARTSAGHVERAGTLIHDGSGFKWTKVIDSSAPEGTAQAGALRSPGAALIAPVFAALEPRLVQAREGGQSGLSLVVRLSPRANGPAQQAPPAVGRQFALGPDNVATCVGAAGAGVFWFSLEAKAVDDDFSIIQASLPAVMQSEFGAECLRWELRQVMTVGAGKVSLHPPGEAGDSRACSLEEFDSGVGASRAVHDAFRFLLVACACLQSFVHGVNDTPNAAAAMVAFRDYSVAAQKGNQSTLYPPGQETGEGFTLMELLPVCVMMAAGIFSQGGNVIGSMSDVLGPELRGSHLVAFCIEVAAQVSAALFTFLGMPISTTHCELGALCLVAYITTGKLNREKVGGAIFALFTAAAASAVLARGAMEAMILVIDPVAPGLALRA